MIDLRKVREVLKDCDDIVESLHGVDHDDPAVDTEQLSGSRRRATAEDRAAKAERSKSMLLLKDRLELAASLVAIEYWYARGEIDPLDPEREDGDHAGAVASEVED